jgi:Domain of unknown function (DUF4911)
MNETCTRYFLVDRRELAYLKFIIEAYEGLAVLSTVEREGAVVKLTTPSSLAADLDLLLAALSQEIPMTETVPPPASGAICGGICHA